MYTLPNYHGSATLLVTCKNDEVQQMRITLKNIILNVFTYTEEVFKRYMGNSIAIGYTNTSDSEDNKNLMLVTFDILFQVNHYEEARTIEMELIEEICSEFIVNEISYSINHYDNLIQKTTQKILNTKSIINSTPYEFQQLIQNIEETLYNATISVAEQEEETDIDKYKQLCQKVNVDIVSFYEKHVFSSFIKRILSNKINPKWYLSNTKDNIPVPNEKTLTEFFYDNENNFNALKKLFLNYKLTWVYNKDEFEDLCYDTDKIRIYTILYSEIVALYEQLYFNG